MTGEEVTRFAMQLREAERIRARIAEDEVAVHTSGGKSPLVAALVEKVPAVEPPSVPAEVAAA